MTRIGTQHQAGSDSLLTAATFFKMRKVFFEDRIEDEFYRSVLLPLTPEREPAADAARQRSPPRAQTQQLPVRLWQRAHARPDDRRRLVPPARADGHAPARRVDPGLERGEGRGSCPPLLARALEAAAAEGGRARARVGAVEAALRSMLYDRDRLTLPRAEDDALEVESRKGPWRLNAASARSRPRAARGTAGTPAATAARRRVRRAALAHPTWQQRRPLVRRARNLALGDQRRAERLPSPGAHTRRWRSSSGRRAPLPAPDPLDAAPLCRPRPACKAQRRRCRPRRRQQSRARARARPRAARRRRTGRRERRGRRVWVGDVGPFARCRGREVEK